MSLSRSNAVSSPLTYIRYFGAGVIVATAFIHLLDPAYGEIGPTTCVGMTGGWADYSWCPAIVLTSVVIIFLFDFGAERYVEVKYGFQSDVDIQDAVTGDANAGDRRSSNANLQVQTQAMATAYEKKFAEDYTGDGIDIRAREQSFRQQIAAFLILEFGVIFHSVIIGLNLGVVGSEFSTLYPVLVFHQSFEGLGIGARMSTIPFRSGSWLPWTLCSGQYTSPHTCDTVHSTQTNL